MKSAMSSGLGMTTTFELGSSDMHRVPSKPWAPSQGLIPLEGASSSAAAHDSVRSSLSAV
jgi:hypothetical protein